MGKSIFDLEREHQERMSAVFDKHGIFWAFSDEAFEEKRKPNVEYVGVIGGGCCPKSNVKAFYLDFANLQEERKKAFQSNTTMDEVIVRELANHECYYTGDYSVILEVVKMAFPECTLEDLASVYKRERPKHLEDM